MVKKVTRDGFRVAGKIGHFFFYAGKSPDLLSPVAVRFFCSPEVAGVSWPVTVDNGRWLRLGVGGTGSCSMVVDGENYYYILLT